MAVKDHSLDGRIVEAAKAEFLAHGFQKASLHKIADRAGITTGALYTRYKNKDALFCSLLDQVFAKIRDQYAPLAKSYYDAQASGDLQQLMDAIRQEERVYLDLMFAYYDECVLFFCRSDGSSVQTMLESMMAEKARQTVEFLKSIAKREVDLDGMELILMEQFRYYRLILEKGCTKEKAVSCLETVSAFLEAGWRYIFEQIM